MKSLVAREQDIDELMGRSTNVGLTSLRPVFSCDIFASQAVGGVTRYFAELHRTFRESGVQSLVLAPLYLSTLFASSVGVVGVGIPDRLRVRGASRLARHFGHLVQSPALALVRRRAQPIVFHPTYYTSVSPPPSVATAVTVYDMIHERYPEQFPNGTRLSAQKRRWIQKADVVLAISQYTKDDIVDTLGIDPARIIVSRLGTTRVEPDAATLEALDGRSFLLYVGQRSGYKNFEGLVSGLGRSVAAEERIGLVAFGGGPPTARERRVIADAGLTDLVRFATGNDSVLAAHYARAVGLVYPSLAEGFGLPLLEAMSHGCAVAAAASTSIPEVVGDAALLFDGADADAIRDAINALLTDADRRGRLSEAGKKRAALFSWAATAESTLIAYARAVENAAERQ
jgi:glycosyltransferase involved in cell wall biosynthesis